MRDSFFLRGERRPTGIGWGAMVVAAMLVLGGAEGVAQEVEAANGQGDASDRSISQSAVGLIWGLSGLPFDLVQLTRQSTEDGAGDVAVKVASELYSCGEDLRVDEALTVPDFNRLALEEEDASLEFDFAHYCDPSEVAQSGVGNAKVETAKPEKSLFEGAAASAFVVPESGAITSASDIPGTGAASLEKKTGQ